MLFAIFWGSFMLLFRQLKCRDQKWDAAMAPGWVWTLKPWLLNFSKRTLEATLTTWTLIENLKCRTACLRILVSPPKNGFETSSQSLKNKSEMSDQKISSKYFRYPKPPQTWWHTARRTYARTPSLCLCPPPRTPSGRRSSSAPSSDELLVELYRCRHGVAWLLCLHHTWSYWP